MFNWFKKATASKNIAKAVKVAPRSDAAATEVSGAISQAATTESEALKNQGNAHLSNGKLEEAAECFRQAIARNPNYAEAYTNLGTVFQMQGNLVEAVALYRKAAAHKPNLLPAHLNLGICLMNLGQNDAAEESLRRVSDLAPGHANTSQHAAALQSLGFIAAQRGDFAKAENWLRRALELHPDDAETHYNLGVLLVEAKRLPEAETSYRRALELNPDYADAHYNLGITLKDQGRLDEAIQHFRKTISIKPDYAGAHSNLLYALTIHPGLSKEDICLASQQFESLIGIPLRATWRPHINDKNPNRRIRVGYVSPDFCRHAVAHFAEPIFASHDKSQVEIFCYAEVKKEDELTDRFRQLADHWHSTVGLSDDAVAKMIHDHQIDILVDLAGHTANNRLLVFARKPAPIQITYLGYPGTTGLSAMDYRITDYHADPEGIADAYYAERLLRLPGSLWCYRPSDDMPEIRPLPAITRGYLTFGSFNNFNKVDQPTLDLWSELLRVLPTSRLMILTVPVGEERQRLISRFAAFGIAAERLEFHGKLPATEFHRKFLEVDITLDPVTVNGATTTCESLWMGVPVISLVKTRFLTRAGLSILSTAGLTGFAAASPEDYVRIAAYFADNLPLLAEIRAGLRDRIAASPLIDEVGFTRNLENLYREIWDKWCSVT